MDEFIVRSVDLLRFEAGLRRKVRGMLERTGREVEAILLDAGVLTDYRRARLNTLIRLVEDTLRGGYTVLAGTVRDELIGLWGVEREWVSLRLSGNASLPSEAALARLVDGTLIHGAPSAAWWERQGRDAAFRFGVAIRQGVVQGETTPQIVRRLRATRGLSELTRSTRNAEAMVRSSVMAIANAARLDGYRANADMLRGVRQVSTLDNRTTDICIAYDGQEWGLDGEPLPGSRLPFNGGPPRHWNCRSTLTPILKSPDELGLDLPDLSPKVRASKDGPVERMSFEAWLRGRTPEEQDDMLGKGRADLWRRKVISLQQLLDQSGRPLSLKELRARGLS
jgi:SPP1 gp7 family putative phage head morphogenesis protein